MNTTQISAKFGGLLLLGAATFFAGCGKEEIKVYSAPKEIATPPRLNSLPGMDSTTPAAAPFHWHAPKTWKELAPTALRVGNFLVEKGGERAEVTILSFPGSVGTELDNVNRWRGEIQLPPISENEIASEKTPIGGRDSKLYDISGEQQRTVVAVLPDGNQTWFFKLRGDKNLVAENKGTFLVFLSGIHFDGSAEQPASTPVTVSAPENSVAEENSAGEPKFDAPKNWQEKPASTMVLKSYSVSQNSGENATVSISAFPGDVGGALANVNRWRGQLGLEPISENELPKQLVSFDVLGGKASMVDLQGTDAKTGKPARMISAMVPRDGQTWFYKLMGDDAVVGREKEAFVQFVQTVRY